MLDRLFCVTNQILIQTLFQLSINTLFIGQCLMVSFDTIIMENNQPNVPLRDLFAYSIQTIIKDTRFISHRKIQSPHQQQHPLEKKTTAIK